MLIKEEAYTPQRLSNASLAALTGSKQDIITRIAELEAALGKAIDYCDAATHGDEQYHDERSSLIRVYRGQ